MKLSVLNILVLCLFTQSKSSVTENKTFKFRRKPSTSGGISNEVTPSTLEDSGRGDNRRHDLSGGIGTTDRGFSNFFDGKDFGYKETSCLLATSSAFNNSMLAILDSRKSLIIEINSNDQVAPKLLYLIKC